MSTQLKQSVDLTLETMLEKLRPKARYISEVHVDEYNDSIYKQIINGDIEIPKEQQPIDNKESKEGYEDMLRKKFMEQIQKEKANLEHKLSYISNSINSLKKHDQIRASGNTPASLRASMIIANSSKAEDWREQIKEREKDIQEKKKKIQEEKKKREQEMVEHANRLKEEQCQKKKKEIMEKMKAIEERMKNREQEIRTGNERVQILKSQKNRYEKLNESYQQKEKSFLQEQKKKLTEIRNLRKPIDESEIKEHEAKFMELKRQKQELRERERRMNQSRSKTYKPVYESVFYRQVVEEEKHEEENPLVIKNQKMKQFSEHVKEHFVPSVSEKKKEEIQQLILREKRKQEEKLQREKQLLEMSKVKGREYLQNLRSIPKKKKEEPLILPPQSDRIKYENYLTHRSSPQGGSKHWSKILNSSADKESKAIQIQLQSQRKEQELKRMEQSSRLLKKGDSSKIDDEYFNMIKAKLDLLKD